MGGDSQLMDFVESEFLEDQLNSIKEISDWVTQLRRSGDALYAMELSLALEKLNYEKLLEVHAAGEAAGDSQLMDFVESEFLEDQLNSIKEISDWVTPLAVAG